MPISKQLALITGGLLLLSLGQLEARSKRRASPLYTQGIQAEQREDFDKALEFYQQARAADPGDSTYQLAVWRMRFRAAQKHVETGIKIRATGKLQEALEEFEKAYITDPSSSIAQQELRRTVEMIEREKKKEQQPGAKPSSGEERGLTPIQLARREAENKMASQMPVPELRPLSSAPLTLKINNQPPKVLYETVCKLAGVNIIFDPDFTAQAPSGAKSLSLDLTNSSLEQALDYLSILTKTFWKPLSPNAIFVTIDDVQRRRNFEEQVVRVFYMSNVGTAQEFNELATMLRQVTGIQSMLTYTAQNALIVRAEADRVALCERLIAALDKPKPEVLIDVYVMEVGKVTERDYSAGIQGGLNIPANFIGLNGASNSTTTTPTTTGTTTGTTGTLGTTTPTTTAATFTLAQLGHVSTNDFSTTLPNALLQAVLSDSSTRIMQSPQLRAVDGQKCNIKVGERVPYATGSFQPGIGTVGVSPLVSTQFQFLDTGVNLEITPKVNGTDEISLEVDLDVSQVDSELNLGGINEPVVGQRKASLKIRLRDGEVSMVSGLKQDQETKTVSGIPVLANIPILGKLFSSEVKKHNYSELLVAFVPHLLRAPSITAEDMKSIASGTFTNVKLSYAPRFQEPAPAEQPPAGKPAAAPEAPAATTPPATAPAVPAAPESAPRVSLKAAPPEAQVGGTVTVTLDVQNVTDLFNSPVRLKFDPNLLRLNEAMRGNFLAGDGKTVIFTRNILNDSGDCIINLSRMPGDTGVSGGGPLLTFTFQALARGTAKVGIPSLTLSNSQSHPLLTASPEAAIEIK